MSGEGGRGPAVFDESCVRCGSEDDLVEDENMPGLYVCRECLERVERQNEAIRRGLEEEPDVEA